MIKINGNKYMFTRYMKNDGDIELNVVYCDHDDKIDEQKFYWVARDSTTNLAYCNMSLPVGFLKFDILSDNDCDYFSKFEEELHKDALYLDQNIGKSFCPAKATDVLNYISEYISNNVMFTSVDISNAIKRDGKWIRNRRVCDVLNYNDFVRLLISNSGYTYFTRFNSNGHGVTVYGPLHSNPDDYPGIDQKILDPYNVTSNNNTTVTNTSNLSPVITDNTVTAFDGSKYVYYY